MGENFIFIVNVWTNIKIVFSSQPFLLFKLKQRDSCRLTSFNIYLLKFIHTLPNCKKILTLHLLKNTSKRIYDTSKGIYIVTH